MEQPMEQPEDVETGQGQVALLACIPKQQRSDIAIFKCHSVSEQFAEANGFLVAFNCRDHNKALNVRLHQFTNDEHFAIYS
ncbi:hypothetical protein PF005_g20040 [Phytophthora fragariae]|uniref:Uncharacterized protein n=1 Tax=Phytophthora fragariae TaxID=53985 RepID=A0A6A4CM28_9STRA|nr:hypothetical protein PF003_g6639 [Phytophthora fragariae]KAE8934594.1 hypothetical protein PF009_g15443 [Phytophthora fragariae]KAE8993070.1 hypothetical protein PF011_g17287 [Phytophthora fragariae]KAE9090897.1 hypothetical protein PF010_g18411 [Phytophthora fragariae]KAE9102537.1 hypothetical protein PF007_g14727 [Phytophthora fragariae]